MNYGKNCASFLLFCLGVAVILALPRLNAQEKKGEAEELKAEELLVPSADGYRVYACLRKPEGNGPFPAIIVVHGGVGEANQRALRSHLFGVGTPVLEEMFKAGYVVVMSDFRRHAFGGLEIDDVVAVFNHVVTLPYVDKKGVGFYGASHGAYIALMAATVVRPAAVVACAPPVDLADIFRNLPETPSTRFSARSELGRDLIEKLGGTPESVPEKYREISILSHIARISCPVLIIQGTADQLMGGAKLLKSEMDRAGKSCELALYEGAPHGFYWGITRAGGVSQATKDALARTLSFFNQHLRR